MDKTFIFGVITYNHSQYILEHLESIKFLINRYGREHKFKLVLADDGSKDDTVKLVKSWLSMNSDLFVEAIIEADGYNRGTCANYTNLWKHIDSDLFKITAGDDVYSNINIFEAAELLKDEDFVSGIPLILEDGNLNLSKSTIFHMMATDAIYKNKSFIERMKYISVINTPSLFYNRKFLQNADLYSFIRKFKVTEDFPMMVRIAETYPTVRFIQTKNVYIYYRRTAGSVYIVRGNDFDKDKIQVFNHLLGMEKSFLGRVLLKNRIFCFSKKSIQKKFLNFNYYIYLWFLLMNSNTIIRNYFQIKVDIRSHIEHYRWIRKEALKAKELIV